MTYSIADFNFKKIINYVDWKLLLFLMLFLDVKLAVKIPAIIIIYLLRFNFKFGFSIKNSRLPLFYLFMIMIAFADLFINKSYTNPYYFPVFLNGIGFWILCLLAIHQVKLSVENNTIEIIQNTILVFFVINAIVSFYNIGHIMWESGAINPYRYQGERQKYFIGTGDYIKGLTFDTSTTNAVLNAFGVIYFLARKNALMTLLCMAVLLFTGSNFMNIALSLVLVLLFVFKSAKEQKSLIVICLVFLVVFMAEISPQNNRHLTETFSNTIHLSRLPGEKKSKIKVADSATSTEYIRRKIASHYLDSVYFSTHKNIKLLPVYPRTVQGRIIILKPDVNAIYYQESSDTTAEQKHLLSFISKYGWMLPQTRKPIFTVDTPGKALAMLQTIRFLQHHPAKIIAGDGIGNFSSKLAFKATSLGFAGGYPRNFAYISNDFLINHLDIYVNFFSKAAWLHTLTNSPFSVYDQILAEYGLLGLLAFAVFYIGFFTKHFKKLTYGIPLLLLLMAAFFIDYWFEQLSVIVFFELLILLNIKETTYLKPVNYGNK
jgi:hypothetical protein